MTENFSASNPSADEITLMLLHPTQGTPIQSWSFKNKTPIRIGRAPDNELVIQSPVVSRHHATLEFTGCNWELSGIGTNGTFVENTKITKISVEDGTVFRLAISGPQLQCCISAESAPVAESTTVEHPQKLEVVIDEKKKKREVDEITSSPIFEDLRSRSQELKNKRNN